MNIRKFLVLFLFIMWMSALGYELYDNISHLNLSNISNDLYEVCCTGLVIYIYLRFSNTLKRPYDLIAILPLLIISLMNVYLIKAYHILNFLLPFKILMTLFLFIDMYISCKTLFKQGKEPKT